MLSLMRIPARCARALLVGVGALLAAGAGRERGAPATHGEHDATVRHSFADVETWVARFDDPTRAAWQKPDSVVAALPLGPGKTVLDIGAGTGYFNRLFAERVRPGGRVFAADVEPNLVAHMFGRARSEATPEVFPILVPIDEPRIPIPADVVFICDTYHHIDDRIEYLGRVGRLLAPGGVVAIVDFIVAETPVGPPVEHRLPPEQIEAEMAKAGFRLARRETFLPYQYFLVFERAR
jgi:SAM-dependent methyltransferase